MSDFDKKRTEVQERRREVNRRRGEIVWRVQLVGGIAHTQTKEVLPLAEDAITAIQTAEAQENRSGSGGGWHAHKVERLGPTILNEKMVERTP